MNIDRHSSSALNKECICLIPELLKLKKKVPDESVLIPTHPFDSEIQFCCLRLSGEQKIHKTFPRFTHHFSE